MAWTDAPTNNQLNAIFSFIDGYALVPTAKSRAAVAWLSKNADRRQASDEMQRLRELKNSNKLTKENCFDSKVWGGFEFDDNSVPTEAQISFVNTILKKHFSSIKALMASSWLKNNATRGEIAKEIDRLKELEQEYRLDGGIFDAPIWDGVYQICKKESK